MNITLYCLIVQAEKYIYQRPFHMVLKRKIISLKDVPWSNKIAKVLTVTSLDWLSLVLCTVWHEVAKLCFEWHCERE